MTQGTWPPSKAETVERLNQWWRALQQTLDGWSDTQMTEPRDAAGWSVKDHLSHLMVWERGIVALLRRQPRNEAMGFDEPTMQSISEDEINARIQQRFATESLAAVRDELDRTHAALMVTIEAMPPGDLLNSYNYFLSGEANNDTSQPVLASIFGNSGGHFEEHLPWMRAIVAHIP
ncbi:MAG: maleylpyruvate isomerase N-terminal domain-containing protein [Chloroflexi bacterium]|nr:maleylpyruvate isomerase N-terminal domain-containing protein [Chloroflexota bacterium]